MRILVVEDEKRVSSFLKKGLEEEHYAVDVAADGEEGLDFALSKVYDAIILDIMLPKMDGIEALRRMRKDGVETPVLMLTAKDTVEDRVEGLDAGSDDYLPKPFAFAELLARLRALLRRGRAEKATVLEYDDLKMDLLTHEVSRGGQAVSLTGKEHGLLEYFLRNAEKVLTRTMIAEHVWNYDFDSFTNVIDVYINYLRNKVDKPFEKKLIHTIRSVGYVLKREEKG